MPAAEVVLADTPESLARALEGLDDLRVVGIDVERADWDRYWRAAALIQVGGQGRVALVDPMALPDLSALNRFCAQRVCVLHAMDNDLGPLASAGVTPPTVEDTGVAAAVLGLPLGLEALLRELLEVELDGDKAAMQRADWEARPLTPQMLSYAAGDVADLPALWELLAERLEEQGRTAWYRQELEVIRTQPPTDQRRDWTRTKGLGRLDTEAKARLHALWDAREGLARSTDTAPSRIAADRLLIDLATTPPSTAGELGRRGLRRAAIREFGATLLAVLETPEVAAVDPGRLGSLRIPADEDRELVDQLRALRAQRAVELGIDAGVLCPSRTLMAAVLGDPQTPAELRQGLGLRPWQWAQLGAAFCSALGIEGEDIPAPPLPSHRSAEDRMTDLLDPDALHHELNRLSGWTGTTAGIEKRFHFAGPDAVASFRQRVSALATELDHHPGVEITEDTALLRLRTHAAGGVTQSDIELARRIDPLAADRP